MNIRNWSQLSRKLVDQFDMQYTTASIQSALGQAALSYWGEGVLATTIYPSPFPITLSNISLGGSVGTGIAIDPNGQITEIDGSPDEPTNFTCASADPGNPRWDLLVLSYQMVGDTPVPQPSDPINTINLNLHDDFMLSVIEGTPSGSPTYPAKQSGQIILAGLRVPAGATLGTQITLDLGIRELAQQAVFQNPNIIHEVPQGAIPGNSFTLSQTPFNGSSILVMVDGVVLPNSAWTVTGTNLRLVTALTSGQTIDAWYVYDNPSSVNPISGASEIPVNTGNNLNFNISGTPRSKDSTLVFVDGAPLLSSQFSLVVGAGQNQIVLVMPLAPGQTIATFYLTNSSSVGSGGVSTGQNLGSGEGVFSGLNGTVMQFLSLIAGSNVTITPNGSGALVISSSASGGSSEIHGAAISPIQIDPTVGIVPTSASDQTWWIAPVTGSGNVPVTATPPIAAGVTIGQKLKLKSVASTNYLSIPNVSGVDLDGGIDFGPYAQACSLTWDGSNWSEDSRRV